MARALAIDPEARLTFDIRDTWQARCLMTASGQASAVLLSVLAHNFEEATRVLYDLVCPLAGGFLPAPYLTSAGRIDKTGRVVAKVMGRDGIVREWSLYRTETELRDTFRRLADRVGLSDSERAELFICLQRWVVADRRLDPAMDPRDPDAKRLVH